MKNIKYKLLLAPTDYQCTIPPLTNRLYIEIARSVHLSLPSSRFLSILEGTKG